MVAEEKAMRVATLIGLTTLALVACGDGTPTPDDVVGAYRADVPGTAVPGRAVRLELDTGNVARMVIDYQDGTAPVAEAGTWSLSPRGEVRVVMAREGGFGPVTSDITFRWARTTLTAIAFDTLRWGGRGFALVRE